MTVWLCLLFKFFSPFSHTGRFSFDFPTSKTGLCWPIIKNIIIVGVQYPPPPFPTPLPPKKATSHSSCRPSKKYRCPLAFAVARAHLVWNNVSENRFFFFYSSLLQPPLPILRDGFRERRQYRSTQYRYLNCTVTTMISFRIKNTGYHNVIRANGLRRFYDHNNKLEMAYDYVLQIV